MGLPLGMSGLHARIVPESLAQCYAQAVMRSFGFPGEATDDTGGLG